MTRKEWALGQGVRPVTAYRWFRGENLPVSAGKVDRSILVEQPEIEPDAGRVVAFPSAGTAGARRPAG